jgi:preprotein translocase subunit SecB
MIEEAGFCRILTFLSPEPAVIQLFAIFTQRRPGDCRQPASVLASRSLRQRRRGRRVMAEEVRGNGQDGAAAPSADAPQQLIINAQYVIDLSFENPRAPQSLMQPGAQPDVEINVDVKARNLTPETFEIVLTINATAKVQQEPMFLVELAYGAVVTVKNAPQEAIAQMLLVEAPRIVFPFARAVIATATRDGGFPPLLINPIDFAELLRRQQTTATPPGQPVGLA